MKNTRLTFITLLLLAFGLGLSAQAEIHYTQVSVSIPVGGSYNVDLNGDGVIDFTVQSKFIQAYCQSGDEFIWSLTVTPAGGNSVVTALDQAGSDYASALQYGVLVNSGQSFYPGSSLMGELFWGSCGIGTLGEWLNLPARYLGVQFRAADGTTHYAWAALSTVAYVDQHGHLQARALLTGFAYESNAGVGIAAGAR